MATKRHSRLSIFFLALSSALLLAACGGGGGGGEAIADGGTGVVGDGGGSAYPEPVPAGASIVLRWDPSTVEVTGYTILSGPTPDTVTDAIRDIPTDGGQLDPAAPQTTISAEQDLGLTAGTGSQVCFAIQAYNYVGHSPASDAVCATL